MNNQRDIQLHKEIKDYKESIFFGLSMRQSFFSAIAAIVAVIVYFCLKPHFGTETLSWMCILAAMPFAALGFVKKLKVVDEGIELTEKKVLEAHELRNAHGDVLNLAGSVFIWDKDEVIYLLSASDDTFRKIYAPYTIQWNEIRAALKAGKKKYNFYGTSGIFDESADDYGVFEFKRGFNSYVVELVGDFDLVLDSKRYHMYSGMKKIQSVIKK